MSKKRRELYDFFLEVPMIDGGTYHLDLAIVVAVKEYDELVIIQTPYDEIHTHMPSYIILEAVTHYRETMRVVKWN